MTGTNGTATRRTGGLVKPTKGKGEQGKKRVIRGTKSAATLAQLSEPELKHVGDLADRMREDYQVQLAEFVLGANIRTAQVSVTATTHSNNPETANAAELLSEHIQKLWNDTLKPMLQAIGNGRVAFEKVWDWDDDAGLTYLRKLEDLPFNNTEMVLWKKDDADLPSPESVGAFKGIKLTGGPEDVELDAEGSWWLALDETSTQPHGKSRFIGAPQATWEQRREALKLRGLFIKRFCLQGGVVHAPETITNEDGELVDVFEEIAKAYDDLLAGGLLCMPNDRERNGDGTIGDYVYNFTAAGLEVKDGSPLVTMIQSMDDEQLLSFGILPQTIQSEGVGSFALVAQHMLIMFSVIEDLVQQFVTSFQKYVADKSVEMNFEKGDVTIELTFQKLTERPDDLAVELVKAWLTSPALSPVLLTGAVDLAALLDLVGVPVSDDVSQRLQRLLETARAVGPTSDPSNPSNGLQATPPDASRGPAASAVPPSGTVDAANRGTGQNGRDRRLTADDGPPTLPFLKLGR